MIRRTFGLALLVCAMVVLPQLQFSVPKMSMHGKMAIVSADDDSNAAHSDKDAKGPNGDDKSK